jgi:hypothetical protein
MMTMSLFLVTVVLVALVAAFAILLAKKLGAVEWLQVHGDDFISRLASCDFCMSFWAGTAVFVIVACVMDSPLLVFGGMFSCPITRYLVA